MRVLRCVRVSEPVPIVIAVASRCSSHVLACPRVSAEWREPMNPRCQRADVSAGARRVRRLNRLVYTIAQLSMLGHHTTSTTLQGRRPLRRCCPRQRSHRSPLPYPHHPNSNRRSLSRSHFPIPLNHPSLRPRLSGLGRAGLRLRFGVELHRPQPRVLQAAAAAAPPP